MRNISKRICIFLILFLTLACSILSYNQKTESIIVPTLTNEINQPKQTITNLYPPNNDFSETLETNPCQSSNWELIPTKIYKFPGDPGWIKIIIPMTVYNHTSQWGRLKIYSPVITTEDGFSYTIPGNVAQIPKDSNNPYSGNVWVESRIYIHDHDFLPPGFLTRGYSMIGGVYGNPDTWFQLYFVIPESQNHFILNIPVSISCILDTGEIVSQDKVVFLINLDEDIQNFDYPTLFDETIPNLLGYSLNIPEFGTFNFIDVRFTDWDDGSPGNEEIDIDVNFTNANQGYNTEVHLYGYLLGEDGLIRHTGCGMIGCDGVDGFGDGYSNVGPSQTKTISLAFLIDPKYSDYKFVYINQEFGIYQVFNLPPPD